MWPSIYVLYLTTFLTARLFFAWVIHIPTYLYAYMHSVTATYRQYFRLNQNINLVLYNQCKLRNIFGILITYFNQYVGAWLTI